jgi:hypothetical protein
VNNRIGGYHHSLFLLSPPPSPPPNLFFSPLVSLLVASFFVLFVTPAVLTRKYQLRDAHAEDGSPENQGNVLWCTSRGKGRDGKEREGKGKKKWVSPITIVGPWRSFLYGVEMSSFLGCTEACIRITHNPLDLIRPFKD